MPRKSTAPSYRFHKARNCAVVTINGKNYYLGEFGSLESKQRYSQLIAEKWADLKDLPDLPAARTATFITIDELIARYMTKHVVNYYVNRLGQPSERQYHVRAALRPLHELFGHTPVNEFGPKRLKLVREHLIKNGTPRMRSYHGKRFKELPSLRLVWHRRHKPHPCTDHMGSNRRHENFPSIQLRCERGKVPIRLISQYLNLKQAIAESE